MGKMKKGGSWFLVLMLTVGLLLPMNPLPAAADTDKLIAFTFDDGPSGHTAELLDGLEARGAVATFFMNGSNGAAGIINHRELLQRMIADGDQLANHTYAHKMLASLSAGGVSSETEKVESLLFEAMGGSYTDMVRSPGGELNSTIRNNVSAPIILWSVDTLDWKSRNADSVYSKIMNQAQDGSIVLMHDLYPTSISGALRAIDSLQAQGYTFVTVAELLRRRGIVPANGEAYYSAPNQGTTLPPYQAPVIYTQSEAFSGMTQVYITVPENGVSLYYTTDGSVPTMRSIPYNGPFTLKQDSTLRAIGYDKFGTRTPVSAPVQLFCVQSPTIAAYEDGMLTLANGTAGAEIYYTTDGSEPTEQSEHYTGSFPAGKVTKAIAVKGGSMPSAVTTITVTEYGDVFTDVEREAWYYADVKEAVHRGLMSGTDRYQFAPEGTMTRAMICMALYRLAGTPEVEYTTAFTDVPNDEWYAKAVAWAKKNGIMAGVYEDQFMPDGILTRQQLSAVIYRYAVSRGVSTRNDCVLIGFDDVADVESYAVNPMRWGISMQFYHDLSDNCIRPLKEASRAECAIMLLHLQMELEETAEKTKAARHMPGSSRQNGSAKIVLAER